MSYDLSKLRGKIVEKYGTLKEFHKVMGWSEATGSAKMTGKIYWNQEEIFKASELLGLEDLEIKRYFFDRIVQ